MKKNFTNALMVLVAFFCFSFSLKAVEYPANVISVPTAVDADADGVAVLPISLNNNLEVSGLQIELTADGVSFGQPEWTDRLDNLLVKEYSNNIILLAGTDDYYIAALEEGEDAVIANVPVTFNEGTTAQSVRVSVKGTYVPVGSDDKDVRFNTVYTVVNTVKTMPLDVPASITYTVDEPATVSVGLDNEFEAGAITIRFTVPEGVEVNENAVKGERVAAGTSISKIVKGTNDVYSVNLINFSGSTLTGNTGEILSFEITATELLADGAAIDWTGSEISTIDAQLYMGEANPTVLIDDTTAAIIAAYEEDEKNLNDLTMAMQEFNTIVDEEFPGYAELKMEEFIALTAKIQQLSDDLAAALSAANATGEYVGISAGITAATEEFLALVAGMEETLNEIQEAYNANAESVNELAMAYQEFVDMTGESFPAYLQLKGEELAAVYAKIEDLNNQINAAMESAFMTGVYDGPATGEIATTTEELMALVAGMDEALNEIETASDADAATLENLASELEPIVAENEEANNLNNEISNLLEQVSEAKEEALNETGVYASPLTEDIISELTEAVANIVETSGINGITVQGAEAIYYNLNGSQIANPANGKVYIKVVNGKATKVLKK